MDEKKPPRKLITGPLPKKKMPDSLKAAYVALGFAVLALFGQLLSIFG